MLWKALSLSTPGSNVGHGCDYSSYVSPAKHKNIIQQPHSGAIRFQGTISQPGTVTVNGQRAQQTTSTNFVSNPVLSAGTNTVTVVATNGNGTAQTNNYQVVIPAGSSASPTYDADGNMTNNGNGQTYSWDAENRLTAINYTATAGTTTLSQNLTAGTVTDIGTSGSWDNLGNTGNLAFDGNDNTFFDGPDNSGDWTGVDLQQQAIVSQIKSELDKPTMARVMPTK